MRAARIAVGLLLAAAVPARAADALKAFDQYYTRSVIAQRCQPAMNAGAPADPAKGEALQRAALDELRSEFDAVNPTHRRENRIRAEEMLQQQRSARDAAIGEEIRKSGCERLVSSGLERGAR